jgi:hypothetical protein
MISDALLKVHGLTVSYGGLQGASGLGESVIEGPADRPGHPGAVKADRDLMLTHE